MRNNYASQLFWGADICIMIMEAPPLSVIEIQKIVKILLNHGVAALPTDTLYALSCNAFDQEATNKIMQMKERNETKTLPVLVSSIAMAQDLVYVNDVALELMKRYWPGALTIVLPAKNGNLSKHCLSEDGYVAVRMPAQPLIIAIMNEMRAPLVGTSANLSSMPVLTGANQIMETFGNSVQYAVDVTAPLNNLPSTIVKITESKCEILRAGAIDIAVI